MGLTKKRAVRRKGFVEDVSVGVLLKKNKSLCGICGMVIPKDVRHPHPMSATIDHIIPMSLGGSHSYDNTQPAHRKCNVLKHIKPVGWTYEKN